MLRLTLVVAIVGASVALGFFVRGLSTPPANALQDEGSMPGMTPDMQNAWKRYMELCQPSEAHDYLAQFIGEWDVTTTVMGGAAEKGTATYRWLMPGRWLVRESTGTMMGMPISSFTTMGYDNYKKRYVTSNVDSMTTTLLTSEGALDRTGSHMITFGTLDEPLTDEHDKTVKYVLRVKSPDEHDFEVHDLMIGESNSVTKVVTMNFKRKKNSE